MKGYNELTKQLLAAGYDADTYPTDKVYIPHGSALESGDPLHNLYGGFEYRRAYSDSLIFQTGCGK